MARLTGCGPCSGPSHQAYALPSLSCHPLAARMHARIARLSSGAAAAPGTTRRQDMDTERDAQDGGEPGPGEPGAARPSRRGVLKGLAAGTLAGAGAVVSPWARPG